MAFLIRPAGRVLLASLALLVIGTHASQAAEPFCPGGETPNPAVIWCDDFDDGVPIGQKYFEYDSNGGDFVPVSGVGVGGSTGMRVVWQPGEVDAGGFKRMFGRNPVRSQSHSSTDFREIYWRQYLRLEPGWTGSPDKLSRALVFASSNWAEAMVAHLWSSGDYLLIDPVSGIDANGNLATRFYNDFDNFTWLGARRGTTPIFTSGQSGRWLCVEAHVKLNTPGASDGVFEFWIDGQREAGRTDLNFVGTWQAYGINAIFFENYWNAGAPAQRIRYFDNIVISTNRIGCLDTSRPEPPRNLRVR